MVHCVSKYLIIWQDRSIVSLSEQNAFSFALCYALHWLHGCLIQCTEPSLLYKNVQPTYCFPSWPNLWSWGPEWGRWAAIVATTLNVSLFTSDTTYTTSFPLEVPTASNCSNDKNNTWDFQNVVKNRIQRVFTPQLVHISADSAVTNTAVLLLIHYPALN